MNTKFLSAPTDLALMLKRYFCSYLINQRRMSQHTVKAYRDTFKLLLSFIATQRDKYVPTLNMADINAEGVIAFLQYLEEQRENKVQTRNARLAAIRSFFNYVATQEPEIIADIQPILAIPDKRNASISGFYLSV